MIYAGLVMLLLVAALLALTGLPAFIVLVGVSLCFSLLGLLTGSFPLAMLQALPARVIGLLEQDLLQALPLYVLMGALLNRLPLADTLSLAFGRLAGRSQAAPQLAAFGLGALLAPMNGSVGASVTTLTRVIWPRLRQRGAPADSSLAVICVASTLGVLVPPSLVLILLGDAMLRAHTEAVNITHEATRIINTQDVFRGALIPAALFLAGAMLIAWITNRRGRNPIVMPYENLTWRQWLTSGVTFLAIGGLLATVAVGWLYAVEAAASGTVLLVAFGFISGQLSFASLRLVLRDTMVMAGALMALFIAATTFTLVLRAFGTDRLFNDFFGSLPGGTTGTVIVALVVLSLFAFVLDAFEIIFVIVPIIMPSVLVHAPDAVWVAVLALLALQMSFLIPPFGYAVILARSAAKSVLLAPLARRLLPYLLAHLLLLAAVLAWPNLVHGLSSEKAAEMPLSEEETTERLLTPATEENRAEEPDQDEPDGAPSSGPETPDTFPDDTEE